MLIARDPTPLFVKVCGVSNVADMHLCASLGVDAIGVVLTKPGVPRSPGSDRLTPDEAAALVASRPSELRAVLLVHTVDAEATLANVACVAPDALQIQVPLAIDTLLEIRRAHPGLTILKSFGVTPESTVESLLNAIHAHRDPGAIDGVVMDSARGGSGRKHDWSVSSAVVAQLPDTPVLLAGGLTPENVRGAIAAVRPRGVDVMSGVNASTRDRKDAERLRAFVKAVRDEDAEASR